MACQSPYNYSDELLRLAAQAFPDTPESEQRELLDELRGFLSALSSGCAMPLEAPSQVQ